ncbi:MAG TPA: fused MFS/spermidine synthase [Pseudorhodoplanes sp.]|nr:fused MFS/spermidine synthase [Pseudorhodoplanes sp.]
MSALEPAARLTRARSAGLLLPAFAATIFLSATLLFSVQPMFTKMVLPMLGGSPSVWSVAMVFFQAVLLAGYGYAHVLTHWFDPRRAALAHLCVIALAFVSLPIAVATALGRPPAEYQAIWLIGLFGASIGLPFFAVAANAPLLQAWFAQTSHLQARDPYFLYGASNLGSFAALLAYPALFEPLMTLRDQSALWSKGFGLLGVLIAACAVLMTRNMASPQDADARDDDAAPAWSDRAKWVVLSFVPSALLLAVTAHISTDIASAPFLWVIPLALYLLTFVLTFRTTGADLHAWMVRLQPIVLLPLAIGLMGGSRAYWLVAILLSLGTFVISTMICHRELYLRRPAAGHLTEFYMWIAVGGVVGGIFSGLAAPFVFPDLWEYPILIVLALLCRPRVFDGGTKDWLRNGVMFAALCVAALIPYAFGLSLPAESERFWMIALVILAAVGMLQAERPPRLVGITVLILVLTAAYRPGLVQTETARSFFGVHKVVESADGRFRMLYHGTTLHGAQRLRDDAGMPVRGRPEPLTYYYDQGLFAEVLHGVRAAHGPLNRVAVVGLGSGSLACYSQPGEQWTYFEIDPVVVQIARDPSKFRFLSDCAPQAEIVLGDARLTIGDARDRFDLIILDAFSSDVVPVHLLTREALAVYLEKLAPGGVMAFHISNRYLELASVVREVAALHGLSVFLNQDTKATANEFLEKMHTNSLIAVLARRESDVSVLTSRNGWRKLVADGSVRPWTDDYSDILSAIWRMHAAQAAGRSSQR